MAPNRSPFMEMNAGKDFDDALDDILQAPVVSKPLPPVEVPSAEMHYEPCYKCRGTGQTPWGTCFKCQGKGGKSFKQPAAVRQHNREQAVVRKVKDEIAILETFAQAYPAEALWMATKAPTFGFAASMRVAVVKYGDLTEKQLAAVRSCMARDAERVAARTEARKGTAIDVAGLDAAFSVAREKGAKVAVIRTKDITFSLAKATGKNPGAIYAKTAHGGTYLGKIIDGKFSKAFECTPAHVDLIVEAARDPKAAALRYAVETGSCSICGALLTDPESIKRGIGPICASKFGW